MITIYVMENHPWVYMTLLDGKVDRCRWLGEWTWVGRT